MHPADQRREGNVVSRTGWRRDTGASVYHFDVGDAHFIPEITLGPIVPAAACHGVGRGRAAAM